MRKVLILTLALWTGVANFAYASAKIQCADMMKMPMTQMTANTASSSHACCPKKVPCQCSVQAPSNDQIEPSAIQAPIYPALFDSVLIAADVVIPQQCWQKNSSFESPPKQPPLYQQFCAYRI